MSYTKHSILAGTGYPTGNGIRIAFLKHIPPNTTGRKPQVIVYLHGIDHRGPFPTGPTNYGTVDNVANKGVPLQIKNAGQVIPAVQIFGSSKYLDTAVLAPQCYEGYGVWHFVYGYEIIKYIKENMQDEVDINRIHLVGYSLGGGGVISWSHQPGLISEWASITAIAPGYNAQTNYPVPGDSGCPIRVYATVPDELADISIADGYVNNLNAQKPVWPVQFKRFSGVTPGTQDHDDILPTVVQTNPTGASFELSSGGLWVQNESLYQTCAKFTLLRMKRAA